MSKAEEFLREYEQLCQKYKMGLAGCGCCGSPYLVSNEEKVDEFGEINYNEKLNKIFINGNGFWHEQVLQSKIENNVEESLLENEKTIDDFFKSNREK